MAFVIADRVWETTTTTGTGDVTLAGAVTQYRAFSSVCADGSTVPYAIIIQGGTDWEVGIGTFNSGAGTISRTTVLASTNANAAVNFGAGTKDIILAQPSERTALTNMANSWTAVQTVAPLASTTGSPSLFVVTGPAHTTLTASTEAIDVNLNLARIVQFATGAITTQRAIVISAPTYAFVGASTITNAVTMEISGPPIVGTNATLTTANRYALRVFVPATGDNGICISSNGNTNSVNLIECRNSSNLVSFSVDRGGNTSIGAGATISFLGASCGIGSSGGQSNTAAIGGVGTNRVGTAFIAALNLLTLAAGTTPITIAGTTSQTATLAQFQGQSSTTAGRAQADVDVSWIDNTDATRKSRLILRAWDTATRDGLYIQADGTRAWAGCPAGSGTGIAKLGGPIFDHFVDVSTTHTDGTEDDLYSDTTPASTLATNGDKLVMEACILVVGSATATRRIQGYFAATAVFDSGTLTFASGGNAMVRITVIRESSSVVRVMAEFTPSGITSQPVVTYTRITGLTLTNTQVMKITGIAAGTGAASADIVAKLAYTSWLPAA